ncbi:hypothetical protein [Leclercia adecarboxylata]|uniref:Eaa protein n=1 Tax=Leclercia adecarboxylata TaxID=83655 RepID=A0A855ESM3_9ENTR|nr:hypothetical protein [Leclercia adecarboxylata]KFC98277.1 hypothetical protein GLAD_00565 [Leclercia adecarboxylata ATCC 23216 = NBRC 102595]PHH04811.1 hypothetical protein CRX53_13005 [Leclercia adecarboxylata]UBH68582.1 hypothetical protein LA332_04815 [Leclercia adecarboxylata]SPX63820.1 Uncharacterised protein [Leclercia adecarboxylata]STX22961.1 Uncharacterised protein [Leclercia adecarboxylata]
MTEFTKEQLSAKAREQIAFCRHTKITGEGRTHVNQCSALFEIALAALTAPTEPVYQYRIRNAYNGQVTEWQTIRRDQVDFVLKAQPLNAGFQIIAPPAPVVPAEIRNRLRAEGLEELLKDARDYAPLTAEQWETLTNNWHQTFVGLSGEGDACRAAMLQDAEPVTQHDGLPHNPQIAAYEKIMEEAIPDGYALVPVEPTEGMVIAGFEAELRKEFRDPDAWETYEGMSGCEQAALRAKWCWAAMVAAVPKGAAK